MRTCLNLTVTFFAAIIFSVFPAVADVFTLSSTNQSSTSFSVPSNVVAQVVHARASYDYSIKVTINGLSVTYYPDSFGGIISNPPNVAGPATITLINAASTNYVSGDFATACSGGRIVIR